MRQLIIMLFVISSITLSAQPQSSFHDKTGSVTGRVMNSNLKQPLPYVNIIIKDTDGKIITGGITDAKGNFDIKDIPEGRALVQIKYIGFLSNKFLWHLH